MRLAGPVHRWSTTQVARGAVLLVLGILSLLLVPRLPWHATEALWLSALIGISLAVALCAVWRAAALALEVARLRAAHEEARRNAASIAHDVRGPLGTVTSYLDLLAEGSFGPISGDARAATGVNRSLFDLVGREQ